MEKISSLISRAADETLSVDGYRRGNKEYFSCRAVEEICDSDAATDALGFLQSLGVDTCSRDAFSEFRAGEERQSVRYAWLKFAARVAKEWGL